MGVGGGGSVGDDHVQITFATSLHTLQTHLLHFNSTAELV